MAKAEWGTKRTCLSCGARFYDLQRSPVLCPKCGAEFHPDQAQKNRRQKAPPVEKKKPIVEPVQAADGTGENNEADSELAKDTAGDDKDDSAGVIEDTSEVGEDDVPEVRGRTDKAAD